MTNETTTSAEQNYDIAPEDQAYADQLDAMDPLAAPSSSNFPEHWNPKIELTAKSLPPHLQAAVKDKLSTQQGTEAAAVAAVLRDARASIRVDAGMSADALPLHSELAQLVYDYRDLEREFDRISDDLAAIVEYRTVSDPETGERVPQPVYRLGGARREAHIKRQEDLLRQMRLLHNEDGSPGIEGARRLKQARWESVQFLKQRAEQIEDAEEAKRQAAVAIRQERIAKQVATKVRMARNNF